MRTLYRLTLFGILFGVTFSHIGSCLPQQLAEPAKGFSRAKRPVTVADIIAMTSIGDTSYSGSFKNQNNVVEFSPDGKKFAFLTQKGDLKTDTIEFSLLVFKTAEVFSSPHSEVIATLSSSSNRPAISHVKWLQDSDSITFLGERPGGRPQIYRVDCTTKKITLLTNQPAGVLAYSISDKGDTFVYLAGVASDPRPSITREMFQRGFTLTSQRWDELYTGGQRLGATDPRREVYVKTAQMRVPQRVGGILTVPDYADDPQGLSISPDGRFAVVTSFKLSPPAIWAKYHPAFDTINLTTKCTETNSYQCPMQYQLVDLQKKTVEPLLNAPVTQANEGREMFVWTRENSLLLLNTFLPLGSTDADDPGERRTTIYAAEIILPSRGIVPIMQRKVPLHAFDIHTGTSADDFVTDPLIAAYGPPMEFRREMNGWKVADAVSVPTRPTSHLTITLEEDLNSPPKLVAYDTATKRKAVLLDLNPQFDELTFGRVEPFKWTTRDGYPMEGALYFPPDYVAGKRYPLIIQTHGYNRNRFWPDGPYSTASAAQPLANRGFLVLQIPTVNVYTETSTVNKAAKLFDTREEGPYSAAVFEGAVDALDRRGLVDENRVGLTGFSRTVYHALYALTHSEHHFAAAVAADGVDFGYANCIYYLAQTDSALCEKMNGGGPPYGKSLAGWLKESPTFLLDKIDAPLLLQAISGPIGEWEILQGLRWLKKPVEMINFYPEGAHILVRPQQRLLSQGSVVDWYCFWLKGDDDPDPAKRDQYARWRKMKEEHNKADWYAGSPRPSDQH